MPWLGGQGTPLDGIELQIVGEMSYLRILHSALCKLENGDRVDMVALPRGIAGDHWFAARHLHLIHASIPPQSNQFLQFLTGGLS